MQGLKCRSCKLWGKEAENKNRNQQLINQHNSHVWVLDKRHRTQLRSSTAFLSQCLGRHSWRLPHLTVPSVQSFGK
ncbi:hypothetical protein TNCV_4871051 [Trichonephila clavipes]|nr:hypothetical protein TNCV_4871051 [Trichonephila clavipes]